MKNSEATEEAVGGGSSTGGGRVALGRPRSMTDGVLRGEATAGEEEEVTLRNELIESFRRIAGDENDGARL